uniref:Uncharacterized protein n=1 Tax=Heterorhabditis bacteriophora TaxID=37862 RepID=A0A1I7X034_HETBA
MYQTSSKSQKGRWALSTEANASARETPEKTRGKLTSKLTILGVFQTYRPSPWKLTAASNVDRTEALYDS